MHSKLLDRQFRDVSTQINTSNNARSQSQFHNNNRLTRKMKGWQIHEYGDFEILQCTDKIKMPILTEPNEVLIEIYASSVNPIDVAMMSKFTFVQNIVNFIKLSFQGKIRLNLQMVMVRRF